MTQRKSRSQRIVKIALAVIALTWAAPAGAQTAYYKGKTITMVQGRAPGDRATSGYERSCRILQKNLPGNPTIVSEYMDGGGGRKAANHLFRVARPDGLTIGNIGEGFVSSAVLGESGVQYDIDKLFISAPAVPRPITFFIQGASWA